MNRLDKHEISINEIDALIFDFDGVLTNNLVHLNQDGKEWVSCSRGDGLAFDVLRKLNKPSYIISTERNSVVSARAKKLKIPALQGVDNKVKKVQELATKEGLDLTRVLYVGNDLNDYRAMQLCGYTACPSDSHEKIKEIATFVLKTGGGKGVVRELLEDVLKMDFIQIIYPQ